MSDGQNGIKRWWQWRTFYYGTLSSQTFYRRLCDERRSGAPGGDWMQHVQASYSDGACTAAEAGVAAVVIVSMVQPRHHQALCRVYVRNLRTLCPSLRRSLCLFAWQNVSCSHFAIPQQCKVYFELRLHFCMCLCVFACLYIRG